MYAQIIGGEVTAVGRLPRSARRLDTGQWVMGLATAPVELQQACGWYEVVETERPAETATQVPVSTVEVVEGVPTRVWTMRDKTPEEIAAEAEQANQSSIEQAARDALATNRADITQAQNIATQAATVEGATFGNNTQRDNAIRSLATGAKLLAQQSEAQARQLNHLIRLAVGDLGGTD